MVRYLSTNDACLNLKHNYSQIMTILNDDHNTIPGILFILIYNTKRNNIIDKNQSGHQGFGSISISNLEPSVY